jgi:hypothetical protein
VEAVCGDDGTQVALRAVEMVGDSNVIVIDAGQTSRSLARALPPAFTGTVNSHSLPVLRLLAERPARCRLISLGGELPHEQQAFVGAATVQATAQQRVRTVCLSFAAIDVHGLYSGCAVEVGRPASTDGHRRDHRPARRTEDLLQPRADATGPHLPATAVVTEQQPPSDIAAALPRCGTEVFVGADPRCRGDRARRTPLGPPASQWRVRTAAGYSAPAGLVGPPAFHAGKGRRSRIRQFNNGTCNRFHNY